MDTSWRNESDGSLLWTWTPASQEWPYSTMIATNNLLFTHSFYGVVAIDMASHRVVWTYPRGGAIAIDARGTLFIARTDGKLTAIALR